MMNNFEVVEFSNVRIILIELPQLEDLEVSKCDNVGGFY
jgi:hypothetical protein